jgi:hypothetical protein
MVGVGDIRIFTYLCYMATEALMKIDNNEHSY